MLKWAAISVGVAILLLVLAIGTAAVIGMFLPAGHTATRSITLQQSPEAVWAVISDHAAEPTWWPGLQSADPQPNRNGHPVWRQRFKGSRFVLDLETTEATPPSRLVRKLADERSPFQGEWEYVVTPTGSGCRVTVTERGEIRNALMRSMSRLMGGQDDTIRSYLTALAQKFGEPTVIE